MTHTTEVNRLHVLRESIFDGPVTFVGINTVASQVVTTSVVTTLTATTATVGTLAISGVATLAAAGADQAAAAAIVTQITFVTGSDGSKGVRLPTATAGAIRIVYNTVATQGLKVYPATGADFNDGTTDAAIVIEGKTMAIFVAMDATTWGAIYTADS